MGDGSARGVRRVVCGLGLLLVPGAAALLAAEAKPLVRTTLQPRSVIVGQPVTLTVDVFVPSYFTGAPRFPQIEVKDAVVVFLVTGGQNLIETIGSAEFAGQSRSYLVYPQRPGEFEVAPFDVRVRYAIDAKSSPPTPVPARGGRFTALVPAAAQGLEHFIATPSFELSAAVDPSTEDLKVGDSLRRTVTLKATDAFAMMLPPLSFPQMDGVRAYPGTPRLSDSSGEQGATRVGTRVESVSYVFQKEGQYRLPPIEIDWWDTSARAVRHARLPELALTVAANPHLKAEIPLPRDPSDATTPADRARELWRGLRPYVWPAAVALLALALLFRLFRARVSAWRGRRARSRRERDESAAAYFERLRQAAGSPPAQLLAATYRWLDRRNETTARAARLDQFARDSGDPALSHLAEDLVEAALAKSPPAASSSGPAFVDALAQASRGSTKSTRAAQKGLGPLNPR